MRESGFASTGPNFAKSTLGHSSSVNGNAPPVAAPVDAGAGALLNTPFTKACTSPGRIRPFGPLPVTFVRSTPSSRANLRTEGLACGLKEAGSAVGSKGTGPIRVGSAGGTKGASSSRPETLAVVAAAGASDVFAAGAGVASAAGDGA